MDKVKRFESLVNSVRCKTVTTATYAAGGFESLVNSVRCKTVLATVEVKDGFESLVNSVRCNKLKLITRKGDIHNGYLLLLTNEIMR